MIAEDIMGKIFTCLGEKDDTVAKGVLAGKVRAVLVAASSVAAAAAAAAAAATAAAAVLYFVHTRTINKV